MTDGPKTWTRDERGATAVVFALAIAVLAPLSLGVLDLYVASEQRGKLQDALDAAALYAARSSFHTDAEIDAVGDQALTANLSLIAGAALESSNFRLVGGKVIADASVRLQAFSPAAWNDGPVSADTEVQRAMDRLEIALVLDNTWSMNGTKIATLKTEAKKLIDKLAAAAQRSTETNPIKISLVPFSNTVRVLNDVSLASYDTASHAGGDVPNWVDARGRGHGALGNGYEIFSNPDTDRFQMMKNIGVDTWAGCIEARRAPFDVQETAPVSTDANTLFTPFFWPDEYDGSGFNDYLNDGGGSGWQAREKRTAKYASGAWRNTGTFTYLGPRVAYGPNASCTHQPVIRLSTDMEAVKAAIDGMAPMGETNIPLGLMWGWHTLTPNAPFGDGQAYGTQHLRKIVILMTDGDNTMLDSGNSNQSYYGGLGYVWQRMLTSTQFPGTSTRTSLMNNRLSTLCANMKARNIEIYTIRVEVTSGSSSLLQGCATTPQKFYDVSNVANLGAAFDAIAGAITNLRISH